MPRRGANTTEAGATTSARSRTPAGFNDKHLGGEIRGGRAMGVHHEPSGEGTSRTMPGTVSKPDKHGVYTARVQVRADDGTWVDKHAPSTFFPKTWTRSEVRTCILEAFANREDLGGGNWSGKTRSGITVQGHSDARGVIDSAYPLWE